MYKILSAIFLATALWGCNSTQMAHDKAQYKSAAVEQAVDNRHYTISVRTMIPSRGPSRELSSGYFIKVKGDTLVSYLPYFGRAYSLPYGGGDGLNFTAHTSAYSMIKTKRGAHRVVIEAKSDDDTYRYVIDIFDNGSSSLRITAQQREAISYNGELDVKQQ